MPSNLKHIVLIGFMGSGKSTVGKVLATKMNRPFFDTDSLIVEEQKSSVEEIFRNKGEEWFRAKENEIITKLLKNNFSSIIATGGGLPCYLNNMEVILQNSFSIYLKVGVKALASRIQDGKDRPLVLNKSAKELQYFISELLRKRRQYYRRANITILANRDVSLVTNRIIRKLKSYK